MYREKSVTCRLTNKCYNLFVLPSRRKGGRECTSEFIASIFENSANEADEYDFVLFDRGEMARRVSSKKRKPRCHSEHVSLLHVPAQIPSRVANRFEIRIRQRRRFLATAKLCFLRVRFGMYGLICCFSYRSRTLRPEMVFPWLIYNLVRRKNI